MALPGGLVTFVLTDIEGSTALFRRLGDAYPRILAEHDRLLRRAFADAGGEEVKTIGDAFLVAFADAAAAIAGCVDAQRAVAAHDWPPEAAIRVRMGIHTGPAEPTGNDYVALAVHRVARVSGAAHGGQILVSDATRALAAGRLARETQLVALGAYRLKDFDGPEALHQVAHPGLPADFPVPRTLSAQGHNIPAPSSSFVGRAPELGAVKALLADARLVTVAGPGGVGKTRVALEVAADVVDRHDAGVWVVELAALGTDEDVAPAIAHALGVRDEPGRDLLETLGERVEERDMLLVLDNCEHVRASVAATVHALLGRAGALRVLATSRTPLGIPGEEVLRLRALATPPPRADLAAVAATDAGRLFLERAIAAGAGITDAAAPAVAEICRRLDGLPLALELAAARARAIAPDELARRLDDRFRVVGGEGDARRTLLATVEWSHDLLAAGEQVLLRRLAVFAGSFALDAAEAVCAGDPLAADAVVGLLASLVDQSLVLVERGDQGRTRYLLPETVREYAARRLATADEVDATAERHLAWAIDIAEQAATGLDGPGSSAWLERLRAEHANIAAAFRWSAATPGAAEARLRLAAAMGTYWRRGGHLAEGLLHLESALLKAPAPSEASMRVQRVLAYLQWRAGRSDAARATARAAVEAAEARGGPDERAEALATAAWIGARLGDHDEAREHLRRALREWSDDLRPAVQFELHMTAGVVLSYDGSADAASEVRAALEIARSAGLRFQITHGLAALAELVYTDGRADAARAYAREALALADPEMDPVPVAAAAHVLGWLDVRDGAPAAAVGHLLEALRAARDGGQQLYVIWAIETLAEALGELGEHVEAVHLVAIAAGLRERATIPLDADDAEQLGRVLAAARAQLGEDGVVAAHAAGALLGVEHAIAVAAPLAGRVYPQCG